MLLSTTISTDDLLLSNKTSPVVENRPFLRQNSIKRPNSYEGNQSDSDDMPTKRGRSTNCLPCPLSDFGCLEDIPSDTMKEHYATPIHQEIQTKMIHFYAQSGFSEMKRSPIPSNDEDPYSDLLECINPLAEGVSCLRDENIQLHRSIIQIQRDLEEQQQHLEHLEKSVEETAQLLQTNQLNSHVLETEFDSVKQMITDSVGSSSNDGTFIWKITDVAQKITDATQGRQTSVYSPPFYSSPNGYKMCLRLFLNGDGQAQKTQMSLFLTVMRGEYDALLSWPFPFKIIFCLQDQSINRRHIIDSFRPDSKSNSFQRPRSNMNISSGIPKFFPLALVQQDNSPYVRDDCMFIRCMVDCLSIPKTMIPFVFSIDLGLPKAIQQAMIQAEMERQKSAMVLVSNPQELSKKTDS